MNQAPTVYNYDPISGLLTSTSEADPNPLEEGEWLIPANATLDAPPELEDGHVAVYTIGAGWALLPDHRGTWYNAQGQAVQISNLQADVSALVRNAPPSPEHALEGGQWVLSAAKVQAAFEAWRAQQLAAFRLARDGLLNQLAGIGMAALADGNTQLAVACKTARQGLLDVPQAQAVTAATDRMAYTAAMKAAYAAVAAAAPTQVRAALSGLKL
jgi:hypothetical protein